MESIMAKKKAKPSKCSCLDQLQKELAKIGVAADTALQMNFKTGRGSVAGPFIAVHWIEKPKRGKRLPTLVCAHCPCCGKKKV